ncbi:hypothetical protein BCR44DRAFT_1424253 [Catenaria anguillulae PL171]|uniref:Uncharacterized protein n=1 Tax=Catenaria anguillulae PL171 TaxID=765915 RepID=A0A1Y2I4S1_9FUNG|nr:hypothetical protein BCR44DRAFT_1424253 [Catenaria anguillulae PL171]
MRQQPACVRSIRDLIHVHVHVHVHTCPKPACNPSCLSLSTSASDPPRPLTATMYVMKPQHPLVLLALLAATLALLASTADARTLYVDAARVYLPKLRRLLSFGGFLNQQQQDTIVSLDLSTTWKISAPAMTVLPTGLGEPNAALIPHVTKSDDGTYTISLYPSLPPAQGKPPKQYKITTKDGVKLDSIVPSDVPANAWATVFPCFSSTASVLSELFNDQGVSGDATGFFFGGYPKGTNDTSKANATDTTAEINARNSGNLVTALPTGSRNPPPSSACALGYIAPKKVFMQRAPGSTAGAKNVAVLNLLNMQWTDYAGTYPDASRRGNQFLPYTSASGRTYALSVGSSYRIGGNGQIFSSIWYSDLDGEKPWVNATVKNDPQIMYRHGAVVVDDQLVVVGHTDDVSAAQAATAAAVFKIVETSPGTLEFQAADEFVPKLSSTAGGANGGSGEGAAKTGPSMAVIAGGAVVGVVLLAGAGFFLYRRRQQASAPKDTSYPPPPDHVNPPPRPASPVDPAAAELDDLLFSTNHAQHQQQPWNATPYQAHAQSPPPPPMAMSDYPPALPQPDMMVDPKLQAVLDAKDGANSGWEQQHGNWQGAAGNHAGPATLKPFP